MTDKWFNLSVSVRTGSVLLYRSGFRLRCEKQTWTKSPAASAGPICACYKNERAEQTLHRHMLPYNSTLASVSLCCTKWIFPEQSKQLVIYWHGHLLDQEWQGQALHRDRRSGPVLGCGALQPPPPYWSGFGRNTNKINDVQYEVWQGAPLPYFPTAPTHSQKMAFWSTRSLLTVSRSFSMMWLLWFLWESDYS